MGQVQNDVLYLRYRSRSSITSAEWFKVLIGKTFQYSIVKATPRVSLMFEKVEKIECENLLILLYFLCSFCSCTAQNLGRIQVCSHTKCLLYYWCFFCGSELRAKYNWWVTALNVHQSFFPMCHFAHTSNITWKLWQPEIYHSYSKKTKSGKTSM